MHNTNKYFVNIKTKLSTQCSPCTCEWSIPTIAAPCNKSIIKIRSNLYIFSDASPFVAWETMSPWQCHQERQRSPVVAWLLIVAPRAVGQPRRPQDAVHNTVSGRTVTTVSVAFVFVVLTLRTRDVHLSGYNSSYKNIKDCYENIYHNYDLLSVHLKHIFSERTWSNKAEERKAHNVKFTLIILNCLNNFM